MNIDVGDGASVSAVHELATVQPAAALFVCAHGAGGHMSDQAMLAATAQLRTRGLDVMRFNFVYREKKSGGPDPMPLLKACVARVADYARATLQPRKLILGGRSMGGRAASMLCADGFACDGLLLLAYPLHPAGQPGKLRDAHLPAIRVPVLCFNGTRDTLCELDLMRRVLARLPDNWTMHWLQGADHSFHVLKSSGRSDKDVLVEMGEATGAWLAQRVAGKA
ncbi:MAG TPA: alpha/beta family hydrolase [Burkholderiaceae bacterium]|nr:alpha/beta family hydrolase [Burkholderiaceae bacterium]